MADESLILELIGQNQSLIQSIQESLAEIEMLGTAVMEFGGETTAVVNVETGAAINALDNVEGEITEVDDADPTVDVKVNSDAATRGLDGVEGEVEELEHAFEDLVDEIEDAGEAVDKFSRDSMGRLRDSRGRFVKGGGAGGGGGRAGALGMLGAVAGGSGGAGGMVGGIIGTITGGPVGTAVGALVGGMADQIVGGITDAFGKGLGLASDAIEAFNQQQLAETKLASVLEATGHAAGFTMDQMKELASQMQDTTTFGDEVVLNAQAIMATFKNVRGDVFKEAMKSAADMSTVLGTDLTQSSMQLSKALNDPIKGMGALSRAGVSFSEEQKKTIKALVETGDIAAAQKIILDELSGEFGGAAADAANTFSGRMQQMQNRIGDVWEVIGEALIPAMEALAPVVDNVVTALENAAPVLQNIIKWVVATGESIMESLGPTFEWLAETVLTAFTVIETAAANWDDTMRVASLSVSLQFIKAAETIKHWLTNVLPDFLAWFADNWINIFRDMNAATTTVLQNMAANILEFVQGVARMLRGDSANFKFHSLLEGFETTMDELPKIAERTKGPLEEALQTELDESAGKLGADFAERLEKNREFLDDLFTKQEREGIDLTDTASDVFDVVDKEDKDKEDKDKEDKDKEDTGKEEDTVKSNVEALTALKDRLDQSEFKDEAAEEAKKQGQLQAQRDEQLIAAVEDLRADQALLPDLDIGELELPNILGDDALKTEVDGIPELIDLTKNQITLIARSNVLTEELIDVAPTIGALR